MLKEVYFTEESIEKQARQFLGSVKELRDKHKWTFRPSLSTLLVLDMQDFFLNKDSHAFVPSASAIIPNINRLQDLFSANSCPVIQTRHINDLTNAGQMARWWTEVLTEDNPLSKLSESIKTESADILVKTQYDAFFKTRLQQKLRDNKTTKVFISGVMTHLCCETTARSAFTRGFEVFFVIDATATYNRQFHLSSLLNLAHGFAVPILTREIVYSFKGIK